MQQKSLHKKGYTLIEMSMALVIFALLATSLLAVLMRKSEATRYRITNERIAKIEEAIQNFVDANGYIPCPGAPLTLESDANFGVDVGIEAAIRTCSNSLDNLVGMIPTRTLGIPDYLAYDGWERKFSFSVARGMGNVNDYNSDYYKGDIAVIDAKGYERTDIYRPAPNNYGAAYVILSFGPNGGGPAFNKNDSNWGYAPTTNNLEQINYTYRLSAFHYGLTINEIIPSATFVQNDRTINFTHVVAYKRKIDLGFPVKPTKSPIKIPANICTDAKSILSTATGSSIPSVTSALWDASTPNTLATQLYKSAYAISKMCDNPPTKMPQNRDPTQTSYNCGTNPYLIRSANLQLWLDAHDPFSNYNNTSGGSCVGTTPTNGAIINTWCDKSGNNRNGTGVGTPQIFINIPNSVTWSKYWMGLSGMKFTFAADWTWLVGSPYTIFYLFDAITSGDSYLLGTNVSANDEGMHIGTKNNFGTLSYWFAQYNDDMGVGIPRNYPSGGAATLIPIMPTVLVASNTNVGTSSNIGRKLSIYQMNGRVGEVRFPTLTTLLGGAGTPGLGQVIGFYSTGYIGEIIMYNADLTAQERASIVSYLMRKWYSNECP